MALALVFGMGASTWLFLKEREAHQRAIKAEQQQARLRLEAETREKITQAALLVSQERFAEADALLKEISLEQPTLEGAAVIRAVGEWHALENRWKEAAQRFSQLLDVDALEGIDVITLDYLRSGPALLEAGDHDAYRRFRDEAVARFARAASPFSDRIVKISLLGPTDGAALAALAPIAADNTRAYEEAQKAGDVFQAAWRAMALALLEYRKGNYAAAAEWARRSVASSDQNASRAMASTRAPSLASSAATMPSCCWTSASSRCSGSIAWWLRASACCRAPSSAACDFNVSLFGSIALVPVGSRPSSGRTSRSPGAPPTPVA